MGDKDPIETLVVAIEGDVRKLLKDIKEGIVLAEDELTQISLQPVQLMQDVKTTTASIKDRFLNTLNSIGARAQETFGRFTEYLSGLVGGYQRVDQAASAATMNQQRMNQLLAEGAQTGATLVQELTALVIRLSEASGEPFENIIKGMVQAKQVTADQGAEIGKVLGVASGETGKFAQAIGALGKVANSVFGVALGISAIQVLRKFVAEIRNAVADTIELQTSLVRLQVAVRAAQRFSGEMVGSIEAWQNSLDELGQTYQHLSEVDLQAAGARVILLTRQMKFNQDQIQRTMEAAAQLSALYQIDMNKAISLVSQGLTGIARGLRMYGVQLSRAILVDEARAQGLRKSWEEMNAAERAAIALSVIEKQLAGTTEDLNVIYDTLGGRLQTAQARARDAKAEIGTLTAWLKVLGQELWATTLEAVAKLIGFLEKVAIRSAGSIAMVSVFVRDIQNGVPVVIAAQNALDAYAEATLKTASAFGQLQTQMEDVEGGGGIWANLATQLATANEEATEALQDLATEYGNRFAEMEIDLANRIEDAWQKMTERLKELAIELAEKQAEAWRKRNEQIEDVEIAFGYKLEDIEIRTAERLANLQTDLAEKRAKILQALYKKLRRLQEDYQLESQRSRLRFIGDLQDAVANRDAFAAVRLIKRQRREQRELLENYQVKRRRAIEDAQDQLANLNDNLEAQRQAILRDRERAIEAAKRWRDRRLYQIDRDYDAQMAKLDRWFDRKSQAIRRDHKLEVAELRRHHRQRQIELAQALAEEESITEEGARAIFDQLDKVFGLGGMIEVMMDAFRNRLATRIEIETRVNQINVGGGLPPTSPMLPTVDLQDYESSQDAGPSTPPQIPQGDVAPVIQRSDTTTTHLGVLEIDVRADEHFSKDFEDMVGKQIADFVGRVIVNPRRV